ncbi:MAG TPA: proprotein convertase P-domain-containing protein, partial [Bacteroidales bacterium]|nr:proprotein convertase P-domain-containing protein [Bacteroidales bacterium]
MASLSMDMKMELIHDNLQSGNETGDRTAKLFVNSNHPTATGDNAPRLYYRVNGGEFMILQPSDIVSDTFYFTIPGQPMGSIVDYYLAAQNEDGTMVATLPGGGYGIDPPGTIAPSDLYTYMIADITTNTLCSNTLPKQINDLQHLYDTITVNADGMLLDLNVEINITHTYVGDLEIFLIGPDGTEIDLCISHGGSGNNFSGTIFDDEADMPISQGAAPFYGSYIPDEPLGTFIETDIVGNWVLHIYDNAMNDQGTLNEWCLTMSYSEDDGIDDARGSGLLVRQNYPNPFRDETNFLFELTKAGNVSISVIDMMGRVVQTLAEKHYSAGRHEISWQAGSLPAGNYFYRVQTEQFVDIKRMMIIK